MTGKSIRVGHALNSVKTEYNTLSSDFGEFEDRHLYESLKSSIEALRAGDALMWANCGGLGRGRLVGAELRMGN